MARIVNHLRRCMHQGQLAAVCNSYALGRPVLVKGATFPHLMEAAANLGNDTVRAAIRAAKELRPPKPKRSPVRTLSCCCCGEWTKGRQWWNRDAGYGLCPKCGDMMAGQGEDVEDLAGKRGVHWDIKDD